MQVTGDVECLRKFIRDVNGWRSFKAECAALERVIAELARYESGRVVLTGMVEDLNLKLHQVTLERDAMLERIAEAQLTMRDLWRLELGDMPSDELSQRCKSFMGGG